MVSGPIATHTHTHKTTPHHCRQMQGFVYTVFNTKTALTFSLSITTEDLDIERVCM